MNHSQGKRELNNLIDEDGNVIIKTNPQYGDQKYFAIRVKDSYDIVGFFYPHSVQSDEQMIANAKLMSAAPELLWLAKRALAIFSSEANYPEGTIGYRLAQDAKAAIKKAGEEAS